MDIRKLNQDFEKIAEKKTKLSALTGASKDFAIVENELNELLDSFIENYGTFLEEIIYEVHDEFCPDNDVLSPIAYIAKKYVKRASNKFEVEPSEGVQVDVDDFPEGNNKLVMVPSPCRLIIQNEEGFKETVWQAGN